MCNTMPHTIYIKFTPEIGSYQYGNENDQHWPYFDYVSDQSCIEDFLPNTDFNYIELQEELLKEYSAYLQ